MSDPYWEQTVLLLHCNGSNGSTVFQDAARRNLVTANGHAQISTVRSKFDGSAAYFDGSGDYLALSKYFAVATGESFTIEAWVYMPLSGTRVLVCDASNATGRRVFAISPTGFYVEQYAIGNVINGMTHNMVANQWHHVAFSREWTTLRVFVDGVLIGSVTDNASFGSGFGKVGQGDNASDFIGYIDELRITKGVARYTANFIAPTAAFDEGAIPKADDMPLYWGETKILLNFDGSASSTYFKDYRHIPWTPNGNVQLSAAQARFGTTSGYFDGIGDFLDCPAIPDNVAFNFGTGDLTIECWLYFLGAAGSYRNILDKLSSFSTGNVGFRLEITSSGQPYMLIGPGTTDWFGAPVAFPTGQWVHLAYTRSAGVMRQFIDGIPTASATITNSFGAAGTVLRVGGTVDGGNGSFNGYMGGVRVTKGVARYTSRFIPPTKAFQVPTEYDPHWPNVTALLPFSGAGSPVDIKGHAVTSYGGASLSTGIAKFHGSSGFFDNSNDVHVLTLSAAERIGTGDFTIEAWIRPATTANETILAINDSDAGFAAGTFKFCLENDFSFYKEGNIKVITAAAPSVGVWHHVALARSSGLGRLYLDGVLVGSATFTDDFNHDRWLIGAYDSNGSGCFNGYIQQVRVTKGVARYTANFTLPTEPFGSVVPQYLSGTVKDANGNFVQRTVRSYDRATGKLIGTASSDPTTGVFSLPADSTSEHFVIVFDDTNNALVYDHITPVI